MRFAFSVTAFGNGVMDPRLCPTPPKPPKPDPNRPDPRARAEMEAFDLLPPEKRAAVRESLNDVSLVGKLVRIRNMGAPREVLERARARGLMPYQLGEGGILGEMVAEELDKTKAAG